MSVLAETLLPYQGTFITVPAHVNLSNILEANTGASKRDTEMGTTRSYLLGKRQSRTFGAKKHTKKIEYTIKT